ncbi:MAG: aminoacyl-tRNA deacylase [Chloroflexota bacterium]|nr:aminoacyl-tRNA deacylase [Chloroflexota bacterium]
MSNKLNSMRLLEQHKIPYEVVEFPDTMRDAEEIAEVLGSPPHLVYKTLVAESETAPKPFLVMIASNRRLDLKKLAQVAGQKKVRMAAHKDAEALTGLKVGGISALALTQKNWIVFLDQPAVEHEHILVSGGQRGVDLRVPVRALITIVRARIADVGRDAEDNESAEY